LQDEVSFEILSEDLPVEALEIYNNSKNLLEDCKNLKFEVENNKIKMSGFDFEKLGNIQTKLFNLIRQLAVTIRIKSTTIDFTQIVIPTISKTPNPNLKEWEVYIDELIKNYSKYEEDIKQNSRMVSLTANPQNFNSFKSNIQHFPIQIITQIEDSWREITKNEDLDWKERLLLKRKAEHQIKYKLKKLEEASKSILEYCQQSYIDVDIKTVNIKSFEILKQFNDLCDTFTNEIIIKKAFQENSHENLRKILEMIISEVYEKKPAFAKLITENKTIKTENPLSLQPIWKSQRETTTQNLNNYYKMKIENKIQTIKSNLYYFDDDKTIKLAVKELKGKTEKEKEQFWKNFIVKILMTAGVTPIMVIQDKKVSWKKHEILRKRGDCRFKSVIR